MSEVPNEMDEPSEGEDPTPRRPTREEAKRIYAKCKKTGESIAKKYRTLAEVNEAFYAGDQWSVAVSSKGGVRVNHNAWFDSEKVPRIAVNLYTGLLMTWRALLTKRTAPP
jgi:hypothetical protein